MSLDSAFAPYAALILLAFLPNEIWRLIGFALARNIDETSEWLVFVRAVATALLAGVVGKLLVAPPDALAAVPVSLRAAALGAAILVFFLSGRRALPAILTGEALIVAGAWLSG